MTGRADFTQEEWELVLEGPPSAGMIVQFVHPGFEYHRADHVGRRHIRSGVMEWKGAIRGTIASSSSLAGHCLRTLTAGSIVLFGRNSPRSGLTKSLSTKSPFLGIYSIFTRRNTILRPTRNRLFL